MHYLPRPRAALLIAALALASPLAALTPTVAVAEPVSQQRTQAPGYYRMMVGDLEVTALYDGYVDVDTKLLKGVSAEDLQHLLARMAINAEHGVQTAVNTFLIHTGDHLVLVDAGAAACFGPTLGGLGDNLKAAGYRPEQIDTLLMTHLHPDHSCGLVDGEGKAVFPNATVFVPQAEVDHWLDPAISAQAPEEAQGFFRQAQAAVAPYQQQGRLQTFTAGDALVPGVSVVPLLGHTPGHSGYLFGAGEQSLLVWGDVIHSHGAQFARPEIAIEFDVDSVKAIESRQRVLADAARDQLLIAGAHLPFPGLGRVRREEQGYAWVPVEFGPIRTDR